MTKPLASFDDFMREHIANRRIERQPGGLGYWAAIDFRKRNRYVYSQIGSANENRGVK